MNVQSLLVSYKNGRQWMPWPAATTMHVGNNRIEVVLPNAPSEMVTDSVDPTSFRVNGHEPESVLRKNISDRTIVLNVDLQRTTDCAD